MPASLICSIVSVYISLSACLCDIILFVNVLIFLKFSCPLTNSRHGILLIKQKTNPVCSLNPFPLYLTQLFTLAILHRQGNNYNFNYILTQGSNSKLSCDIKSSSCSTGSRNWNVTNCTNTNINKQKKTIFGFLSGWLQV